MAFPPHDVVDIAGHPIAYHSMGDGPLVICLHGFPDTAHTWDALLPQLAAAGLRGVAPYLRGYAPTGLAVDGDYSQRAIGQDVIDLMDALGADKAVLVGHDWGTSAVHSAVAQYPERIAAMATLAIPHPRMIKPTPKLMWKARHFLAWLLPWYPEWWLRNGGVDRIYRRWSPTWDVPPGETAQIIADFADPARLKAALRYYRSMPQQGGRAFKPFRKALFATIDVPALCLYGEDDGAALPAAFAATTAAYSSEYRVMGIAGAGHFLHRERPDEVLPLLVDFARKHAR